MNLFYRSNPKSLLAKNRVGINNKILKKHIKKPNNAREFEPVGTSDNFFKNLNHY